MWSVQRLQTARGLWCVIYLSGAWSAWADAQSAGYQIGPIITPDIGGAEKYLTHGTARPWAADNACFARGNQFDLAAYLAWLESLPVSRKQECLFATAPDVVGDWRATWERSRDVLPLLRELGFKAALVLQDGAESDSDIQWDACDVVFIGGSTGWKESAHVERLCKEAKRRGKWVHMGRVNSFRRVRIAADFGCDSVDGTFLKFGPSTNLPKLLRWLDGVRVAPSLFEWANGVVA